jgi:hypothetical protein
MVACSPDFYFFFIFFIFFFPSAAAAVTSLSLLPAEVIVFDHRLKPCSSSIAGSYETACGAVA